MFTAILLVEMTGRFPREKSIMEARPSRSIVPLPVSQIGQASDLIARAFFDDPIDVYMEPDEQVRARMGRRHLEAFVRYCHLAGEVWTTEGSIEGIAGWLRPRSGEVSPKLEVQAGMDAIPSLIGTEQWERIAAIVDCLETLHEQDIQMPHWYLMLLGTEPNVQCRGIGSQLLQPVLTRADAEGIPCYAQTSNLRNVPFYSKHGFELLVEVDEPESGVRIWTMLREPRGGKTS
ncbi:MAG: hypothetical protein CME26_15235 [Gemmatimonadetes bacterium]|nr:hypothetical protein [Gemmatimonadota bacterium]